MCYIGTSLFQQMVQEHSGRTPLLEELEQSVRDLISAEDCENHEQAREFVDQCRQLRNDWMRLEDSVKHLYDESRLKVSLNFHIMQQKYTVVYIC